MTTAGTNNLWGDAPKSTSTEKPQLRVALIGCGGITQIHIDGWKRLYPTAQVVACADLLEARRNERGDLVQLPREARFNTLKEILQSGIPIDAVDICTSNAGHAPNAIEALNAGLHVLCEKPLTTKPQLVRKMIAARDKAKNKILMTAQHMRFENRSMALKEYLKSGVLGEVYYARAQFLRRRFPPTRIGFIDKNISGGGPGIDIGVHIVDLALHLMNYPEPVSVSAVALQKLAKRKDIRGWWGEWDREKFTVEDFAAGFIRFKNGAALTLECSWLTNIKEPELTKITIMGTDAGAEWPELTIHGETAGSLTDTTLKYLDDGVGGHAKEIAAFADAILTKKPSPVPAEQSLNVVRILDGLYRSQAAGKEVTV